MPIHAQRATNYGLNPSAVMRHQMMLIAGARMRELAHKALYEHNLDPSSFIVICIAVDSRWRPFVDCILPEAADEWEMARANGIPPMAIGIVKGLTNLIARQLPNLRTSLEAAPQIGRAKVAILDDTGGTVYEIEPQCEHLPN